MSETAENKKKVMKKIMRRITFSITVIGLHLIKSQDGKKE